MKREEEVLITQHVTVPECREVGGSPCPGGFIPEGFPIHGPDVPRTGFNPWSPL